MAALSRFATTNTWNAQQIFKAATTTAPGFVAQGTGTISAIPTVDANAVGLFQGTEAVAGHVFFSASAATTNVVFRRNNGTYASPTALAASDIIGSLQWQGRGASTFGTTPAAQIRGVATEIFSETARGTQLEFYTTPPTTITNTLRLTIGATATFSVPVISTSEFQVQGSSGTTRALFFRTGSSTRWTIEANSVAESTGNAGSNFAITRYSDAQANLGVALGINRATGVTTLGADRLILTTAYTPPNSSDSGVAGQITWDSNYIYVWNAASGANCVKRIALTTF